MGDPGESSTISVSSDPVDYRVGTASGQPIYETSASAQVAIANLRYLAGQVHYLGLEDHLVSDVTVTLSQPGEPHRQTLTDASGVFKSTVNPDLPTTLQAEAPGLATSGAVDLLDITKVGQHVALLAPFSLAQEWVAADVNRDLAIDGLDISAMLQVALGDTDVLAHEDVFFEVVDGSFTWEEARLDAEAKGGHLATITTPKEQAAVERVTQGNHYWLGASDEDVEGEWQWVTDEPFDYTHWHPHEPNDGGEQNYLRAMGDALWDDHENSQWDTIGYVLERENMPIEDRFELVEGRYDWEEARLDAEARGGHLATITQWEEQEAIYTLTQGSIYWLGATDREQEGVWEWVTGEPFEFTYWNTGEPNNWFDEHTHEDYLHILANGKWNDYWVDGYRSTWDVLGYVLELPDSEDQPFQLVMAPYPGAFPWALAKSDAEARGGHLATINTPEEQAFLEGLVSGQAGSFWLGGPMKRKKEFGNGSQGETFDYTAWQDGQPDHRTQDFLQIWHEGFWDDFWSDRKLGYVLERQIPNSIARSNWRIVDPAFLSTPAEAALFNISRYEELVIPAGLEGDKDDAHLAAIRLGDVDGSLAG